MSIQFIKKGGIDTSDATATAYDLAKNKTAYVKGQKITGKLTAGDFERSVSDIYDDTRNNKFLFRANYLSDGRIIPSGNSIRLFTTRNNLASYIGLTADKLKKDETILGITGTYEGSGGTPKIVQGMKLAYSSEIPNNLDVSEITEMNLMFAYGKFSTIPLFDTSNVTDMSAMFSNCGSLTTVPQFNTSNVTTMSGMFARCGLLTTVPQFNTSNVTDMGSMFDRCSALTTVPQFNTSNVTKMTTMFNNCTYLTTIPVFDTSKVTNMSSMFQSCPSLSNESLNNILLMCANSAVTSNKTLSYISLSTAQATICQGLSNYQDFIDAGWTTGY